MLLEPLLGEFLVLPAPSLPSLYFFAPFNHTAPAVFQEPDAPKQIQKPTALSRESSQRIFFKRRLSKTKHMNKFVSRSAKRGHLFLNDTFFPRHWLLIKSKKWCFSIEIDYRRFYWYNQSVLLILNLQKLLISMHVFPIDFLIAFDLKPWGCILAANHVEGRAKLPC